LSPKSYFKRYGTRELFVFSMAEVFLIFASFFLFDFFTAIQMLVVGVILAVGFAAGEIVDLVEEQKRHTDILLMISMNTAATSSIVEEPTKLKK